MRQMPATPALTGEGRLAPPPRGAPSEYALVRASRTSVPTDTTGVASASTLVEMPT